MTRRRVLIVEDNQDAGEMYRILIELAGHEAVLAENGALGLELFKSEQPDIALVDIGLPGMDGYAVARELRAICPDGMRLVAVSGYALAEDQAKATEAGFALHVAKPPDPNQIERLLAAGEA